MNRLLLLCLSVGIMGCASTTNKYINAYNESVAARHSVVIVKEGDLETLKDIVNQQLSTVGYNKILYSNPAQGYLVLVKDIDFGNALLVDKAHAHAYRIILKYTNVGVGRTRIDLVNGSTEAFTKNEIDKDIQKLAELIRSN